MRRKTHMQDEVLSGHRKNRKEEEKMTHYANIPLGHEIPVQKEKIHVFSRSIVTESAFDRANNVSKV